MSAFKIVAFCDQSFDDAFAKGFGLVRRNDE
jgi:hypothetical protein